MPRRTSQLIGATVEGLLKDFLTSLSFITGTPTRLFSPNLRLMNSGTQDGLDLNWEIQFTPGAIQYKWYFEAKGHGWTQYRRGEEESYHIKLIAEKLLQSLSYVGQGIDCWCLFIPYLKIDRNDIHQLENIQEYLPFKLIVWDKNYLMHILPHISPSLFSALYPLEPTPGTSDPILLTTTTSQVRSDSLYGRFWNEIHKRYWMIRSEVATRCRKELIFSCEIPTNFTPRSINPPVRNKRYFFMYENRRYDIDEQYLARVTPQPIAQAILPSISATQTSSDVVGATAIGNTSSTVTNLDCVRAVLVNAICTTNGRTLEQEFRLLLDTDEYPFFFVNINHKISDFWGEIPLELLNSSTYFNCAADKPVYFSFKKDFI